MFLAGCLLLAAGRVWGADDPEQAYAAAFLKAFPKVAEPPALDSYATREKFDASCPSAPPATVDNDHGALAWGISYQMMAFNEMYKATHDAKYLAQNLPFIRAVLAATDEKRGLKLWTGRVVAAWGCEKYAERGRAVFAVHTGIICAPIFDFLLLAKGDAGYKAQLGAEWQTIFDGAAAAIAVHDRQWRDGPGADEGFYFGIDQENSLENKPLPGNRLSAMGWAEWLGWKAAGNPVYRDRALALGRYIKHRLTLAPDGAYYWPYALPEQPVTESRAREAVSGEDTSHAGLTMRIVYALAEDSEVFTKEDLERFAKTVLNGFGRRGDGMLYARITGAPGLDPASHLGYAASWLHLAATDAGVRERIVSYYLNYRPSVGGLDLAYLIRFGK
jgi:hypothetical protein